MILLDPLSLSLRSSLVSPLLCTLQGPQSRSLESQTRHVRNDKYKKIKKNKTALQRDRVFFVGPDNRGYAAVAVVIHQDRHPRRRRGRRLFPKPEHARPRAAFSHFRFERPKRREMHHQGEERSPC